MEARNGSLEINAFVKQSGFDKYFSMDEFSADSRFGGIDQHDGKWEIWDEPFFGFLYETLGNSSAFPSIPIYRQFSSSI